MRRRSKSESEKGTDGFRRPRFPNSGSKLKQALAQPRLPKPPQPAATGRQSISAATLAFGRHQGHFRMHSKPFRRFALQNLPVDRGHSATSALRRYATAVICIDPSVEFAVERRFLTLAICETTSHFIPVSLSIRQSLPSSPFSNSPIAMTFDLCFSKSNTALRPVVCDFCTGDFSR